MSVGNHGGEVAMMVVLRPAGDVEEVFEEFEEKSSE